MEIGQYDAEYDYDYELDIVNIKVKKEYEYQESIDFNAGVFLDFDKSNLPVNLEIISASKRLNVKKEFLEKPSGHVNISIKSDLIRLDVCFINENKKHFLHYVNRHIENLRINDLETEFALV